MANEDQYERLSDDPSVFIDKVKIYRQNEPVAYDQSKPTTNSSSKEQARLNLPAVDINTFSPEKRRILETLDFLEQELKADRQIKNRNDERLKVILKQFKDVRVKFKQFGNDARFSSAPTELQSDIDECRSIIAIATAELAILLPVLRPEWERQWKQQQERKAREKQLRLEQVQHQQIEEERQQEQERQHQDRLNEELRAKIRAKHEATKRQRVPQATRPLQPRFEPMSSTPSGAGSSGAGCILPILGIIAFMATLLFLIQFLVVPATIDGDVIFAVIAGLSSNNQHL